MNRSLVVFALALALPLTARADDASKRAKAQELIGILHSEQMIGQLSANLMKQVDDAAQQVTGAAPSPEQKTRLDEFEKKVSGMFQQELNWNTMAPEFVTIYSNSFSEEELTAIVNFYKSPAGTAFLTKAPQVNQQINQIAQPKIAALQTQIRAAFDEFRKSQQSATPPTLKSLPPAGAPAPSVPETKLPSTK
jgi:uncharacterized protein